MTTNANERDAAADLAVCEAATPGPWEQYWYLNRGDIITAGDKVVLNVYSGTDDSGHANIRMKDTAFIVLARTALPHWIARAEAAEARAAELERQIADARSLVALKQQDVDSLGRAFADERRAREAAERERDAALSRAKEYAADADKLEISNATLRERGEALVAASMMLKDYANDNELIDAIVAWDDAFASWREINPAKPEKEKKS